MLNELLRQGFRLAHRRINLVFLDLLWKSIWLAVTIAGFLAVLTWFGSEFRSIEWIDTGNRAINTAIAVRVLREFWVENWKATLRALGLVLTSSAIVWFVLEALFRSRFYSPPRRGGEAAPQAQTGWSVRRNVQGRRSDHPGLRPPLLCEEGNTSFRTFLLSNALKCLFIASASLGLSAICFGRYFVTPVSQWPQLWHDTRGAAVIGLVSIAALGFVLTILDTLVRSDAVELLGTDLFRVTGLITILLSFEAMMIASCAVMLGAGIVNISSLKSALAMVAVVALAVALLNLLHSYLLLVRYSVVGIMRQNVIEI